jgi:hypothetical protein
VKLGSAHYERAFAGIEVADREPEQLSNAQSRRVEKYDSETDDFGTERRISSPLKT